VFELGGQLLALHPEMSGLFAPGPYAGSDALRRLDELVPGRARVVSSSNSCNAWFSRAAAILCMAGYNSTLEALAAGRRPILVPRRYPRSEQEIRAMRLQSLVLADVVHAGADPAEVATLLRQGPRHLADGELEAAGIDLGGADAAAHLLHDLGTTRVAR